MPVGNPVLTTVPSSLRRAAEWFLTSGIQLREGGVARYYRADVGQNLPISTEITGYAMSALVYVYRATGQEAYLDAASRAGRFLADVAWDARAAIFPFEYASEKNLAYFFDSGIIVRGLLALHRETGVNGFRTVAEACAGSMERHFVRDGVIYPVLALPSREPLPLGAGWSRNPGCYQLKSALAWLETGHTDAWERALEQALANDVDFLPGETDPLKVMDRLHAYSYFLEALQAVAERPHARVVLEAGIAKLARHLREIRSQFVRADVYAQLLRVRLFSHYGGAVPLDAVAAAEEAAALEEFQYDSPDPRLNGGFCFGMREGRLMPFANPVSTAFCLQAIDLWRQHQAGEFHQSWRVLI